MDQIKVQDDVNERPVAETPPVTSEVTKTNQNSLMDFLNYGKTEKDVHFGSFVVKIRTLTAKEAKELSPLLNKLEEPGSVNEFRIAVLARVIVSINGDNLESVVAEEQAGKKLSVLERRVLYLESMQQSTILELYDAYDALVNTTDAAATDEEAVKK